MVTLNDILFFCYKYSKIIFLYKNKGGEYKEARISCKTGGSGQKLEEEVVFIARKIYQIL